MIEKPRSKKAFFFQNKSMFISDGRTISKKNFVGFRFGAKAVKLFSQHGALFKFASKHRNNRCRLQWSLILSVMMIFSLPSLVHAHRGAVDEIDPCRIRVGFEKIHFTAYTPNITYGKEYCNVIPNLGQTNLVFDYEGKQLRDVSVEFEITKEPEGKRVFYQEPKKIKTGTVNGLVDFSKFGAGDYLVHVAIVHEGNKLDTHLPLSVGMGDDSESGFVDLLLWIVAGLAIILLMVWLAKRKEV